MLNVKFSIRIRNERNFISYYFFIKNQNIIKEYIFKSGKSTAKFFLIWLNYV